MHQSYTEIESEFFLFKFHVIGPNCILVLGANTDKLTLCFSIICGLTQLTGKAHIARACLEAVCFQTAEVSREEYMNMQNKLNASDTSIIGHSSFYSLPYQWVAFIRPFSNNCSRNC